MKFTFRLVVVSVLSLLWAYPALAQFGSIPIENCDDYVSRTVNQVQMAKGCGHTGPQWSLDAESHKTWCKQASSRDRDREYAERLKALVACRGDSGVVKVANCHDYGARFRSQLDLAKALGSGCSFEGMRWSDNLVQHMHWCNRTDAGKHDFEDAARRKELASCHAPK